MLRHYLTITLRHLRKDALHSLINVLGLTLGLTGVILIALYVHHEWRYDRHHEAAGRIYRVLWPESARTGKPMPAALTALLRLPFGLHGSIWYSDRIMLLRHDISTGQ